MRTMTSGVVLIGAALAAAPGCGAQSPTMASSATVGSGGGAAVTTSSTGGAAGTGGATASSTGGATASSTGGATASSAAAGTGGAACVPVDDHDPCTLDACQGGMPVHVPLCTGGASCQGGVCVAPACTGSLGFPAPASISQSGADAVATADFDGDGKPDLAVANGDDDEVTVLRGLGKGAFAAPVSFPAGLGPSNVAAADLNGDGKPDLVVVNGVGGTVSVLLNKGGGKFAPAVDYAVGASPWSIGVADLDGDGKPDVAVLNGDDTVSVLLNQGGGAFGPAVDYPAGTGAGSMAVADLDGDGKPDIAVTNDDGFILGGTVSVLWNQGGGAFAAPDSLSADTPSVSPYFMVAADVDGDGKPDIVVDEVNVDEGTSSIGVLLNKGSGKFVAGPGYGGGAGLEAMSWMTVADLDGDGKPDLAGVQQSDTVIVLLNQGGGAFALTSSTTVGMGAANVAVADFDGDGKRDLAVAIERDTVGVLSNQGAGNFANPVDVQASTVPFAPLYPVGNWPIAVAAGDFDGDGRPDLAVAESQGPGVGVLMNLGDGTFAPVAEQGLPPSASDVAAGDLDGDGRADIVVSIGNNGSLPGSIAVLISKGDGTFADPVEYATGGHPSAVILADLKGNGKPDIVYADGGSNVVAVLRNNGDGTFAGGYEFQVTSPTQVVAADFDGDGKVDLAVAGETGGVNVFLNQGGDIFGPAVFYPVFPTTMSTTFNLATADFDGDGKPDLVTDGPGGTAVFLWNQGNGTFTMMDGTFDMAPMYVVGFLVPADLDGDGKPDVVCMGNNGVNVVLNQGNRSFGPPANYGTGDAPRRVVAVDLNGDGRLDVAVPDTGSNAVSVLINNCLP